MHQCSARENPSVDVPNPNMESDMGTPLFKSLKPGIPSLLAAALLLLLSPSVWAASGDTSTGTGALAHNTGADNTADGVDALNLNTAGVSNTATGENALFDNKTGSYDTADGQGALYTNSTGPYNVAVGFWALNLSTTGTANTAIGAEALYNCVTDGEETALGFQSLFSDKTGFGGLPNQNVALGYQALYSSTDGFENLAGGYRALFHSLHGDNNTALGYQALFGVTTGVNNIGIGHNAGYYITTGTDNIDIGNLGVATDNRIIRIGDGTQTDTYLTGVLHGNGAGLTGVPVSAVTGSIPGSRIAAGSVGDAEIAPNVILGGNTTIGNELSLPASLSSTSGVLNIGGSPFLSNFGGNTFVGNGAGNFTMSGGGNTASGAGALSGNTAGYENTASGFSALSSNTSGYGNTASGYAALSSNKTGNNNVGIGNFAGSNITGYNNIDIGDLNPSTFGTDDVAGESNTIRIGEVSTQTATYIAGIYGAASTSSSATLVYIDQTGQLVTSSTAPLDLPAGSVPASALSGAIPVTQLSGTIPATQVGTPPPGMVLIPGGNFEMGNVVGSGSDSDITNAAPVTVKVSAFYMDANLVSLSQWRSVYYSGTSNGYTDLAGGGGDGAHNPVSSVNWYDCVKWCNARSQQAHLTPVYYTDAGFTTVYKTGDPGTVYMNMAAGGYRLPTEAEWEKAARGGQSGQRFPWGDTIDETLANYYSDTANFTYDDGPNGYNALDTKGTSNGSTTPIGTFAANGYGLYDIAGNVFEWCWDWYGTPYGQPSTTNPTGPASGSDRVLRGGYWSSNANDARCADRIVIGPVNAGGSIGFRSVLSPGQP